MLSKDGEDCIGRTTGLKPGGQWMGNEVLLGTPFVSIEGESENGIEVEGWSRGRRGHCCRGKTGIDTGLDKIVY